MLCSLENPQSKTSMAGESELEKKITSFAEFGGCYVRKFISHHVGVPDRIISKELTLFLEVKDFGEKPSSMQLDEISIICRTGGFATWVDNHADAVQVIQWVLANRADKLRRECKKRNYWMK